MTLEKLLLACDKERPVYQAEPNAGALVGEPSVIFWKIRIVLVMEKSRVAFISCNGAPAIPVFESTWSKYRLTKPAAR